MKFLYVLISVISLITFYPAECSKKSSDFFTQTEKEFIRDMFIRQRSLISNEDKYKKIVSPFLKKAKETLILPKVCFSQNLDNDCKKYYDALLQFNVACFTHYIKASSNEDYINAQEELDQCTEKIMKEKKYTQHEIDTEKNTTKILFHEANQDYYNQVAFYFFGIHTKIVNFGK
jgi:hypothetical protein